MGRLSISNPYYNKGGDRRMTIQFDYSFALRIATGDPEALKQISELVSRRVQLVEEKERENEAFYHDA